MSKIEKLKAGELQELLSLLNLCFKGDPDCGYFEKSLPKLWVDDDLHMGKHYGIKDDGKLVAAFGIYPFEVFIGEEKLTFATVGNVCTHPDYRGRGFLHEFYTFSEEVLKAEGVDAARLGGKRIRYERYGYEPCGSLYKARVPRWLVEEDLYSKKPCPEYDFRIITEDDSENLSKVRELYNKNFIHANRGETLHDFYLSTTAWDTTIWGAFKGDEFAGYLLTYPSKDWAPESGSVNAEDYFGMVCRFVLDNNVDLSIELPLERLSEIRALEQYVLSSNMAMPSHFKILNREKLVNALMKFGNKLTPYCDGEVVVGVEGEGNYRIFVEGENFGFMKTEMPADMTLPYLDAARFMFGPMPPHFVAELPADKAGFIRSIFPLPLYWNNQDRA